MKNNLLVYTFFKMKQKKCVFSSPKYLESQQLLHTGNIFCQYMQRSGIYYKGWLGWKNITELSEIFTILSFKIKEFGSAVRILQ